MKLLHSITLKYVLSSVAVLVLFTIAIYFIVNVMLERDINERLISSKGRIVSTYPGGSLKVFPFFEIDEVPSIPPGKRDTLKDTLIYNAAEDEYEIFREYVSYQELHHVPHRITVRLSLIEKEDVIAAFSLIFGLSTALLLFVLYIVNKRTTTALFAPFYRTLDQMQHFSLRSSEQIALEGTDVAEFKELNSILSDLMRRARKEYSSVKEFSENASHELQTPLAIVTSKLDLLIQNDDLNEGERQLIEAMYQNVGRLTQVTKALLLLSQIETAGYFESTEVDIAEAVRNEIDTLEEIAAFKQVTITSSLAPSVPVTANPGLVGILIKNIFSNAVRHNIPGGTIAVRLNADTFTVSNTGKAPTADTSAYFDRFRKESPSDDSVGLGLAVVKEICALYAYEVVYEYGNGLHTVTVTFAKKNHGRAEARPT